MEKVIHHVITVIVHVPKMRNKDNVCCGFSSNGKGITKMPRSLNAHVFIYLYYLCEVEREQDKKKSIHSSCHKILSNIPQNKEKQTDNKIRQDI